jgi:hypothetical protein
MNVKADFYPSNQISFTNKSKTTKISIGLTILAAPLLA